MEGVWGGCYVCERLVGRSTSRESIDVYRTSSNMASSEILLSLELIPMAM